MIIYKMEATIS